MKRLLIDLAILTIVVSGTCLAANSADGIPVGPVRVITAERGVVPPGTAIVVRTGDKVKTGKAFRSTMYFASIATDILDENGDALIPRDSPVELVVRSVPYLGPGGVGTTLLTLDIDAITVRDVRYPVETDDKRPGPGGIGVDRDSATWICANEDAAHLVITRGHSIDVPANTLLAFPIQAPIRLRGYQR
jgi:hypothetical protein